MVEPPDHDQLLTRRRLGFREGKHAPEPALQPFHDSGGVQRLEPVGLRLGLVLNTVNRRFLIPVAVVVAGLVAVTSALAAAPSLSLTPSTVKAGQTTVIRGTAGGCHVGNTVTIISRAFSRAHEFAGVPAVPARVRTSGVFRATVRVPLARGPGRYTVTARCGGGNFGIVRYLTVRPAA